MEPFANLLTMTPLFDANGNYRFVVAVQYEVASQHVTPSLARRRLVRLGRFLHQLPLMLPYPSRQLATTSMMRTPVTQVTQTSAKEYLVRREASTTDEYDGSSIFLQRKANAWMTRCCWLMRPLDSISSIVNILTEGDITASVVEKFLQASCPDVVRKLVALVRLINVVLQAQENLVAANLAGTSHDVIAMLAILLKTFRSVAKQRRALGGMPSFKSLDHDASQEATKGRAIDSVALRAGMSESGGSNPPSNSIENVPTSQPQRPLYAHSIRTSAVHVSRLAKVTSAMSKGAEVQSPACKYNQQLADALLKNLSGMLHNPHRKNVLLDELRQLRSVATSNLVNLLLYRMMSSEGGELLVEETRCAEKSALQGVANKSPTGATARLRTALGQVPGNTNQETVWSEFLPSLGFAVGNSIGLVAVDMRSPGLPLIFVNLGFEVVTKYSPEESIGRNCSFLQIGYEPTDVSQDYLIEELSASIRSHTESITKMYCFDKLGDRFQVIIALVPIFHSSESHGAYTVGFQVRVETPERLGRDLLILDRMLRLLPRTTSCQVGAATFAEMKPAQDALPIHVASWLSLDGTSPSSNGSMPRRTAMLDIFMRTLDHSALLEGVKQECSIAAAGLAQFIIEVDSLTAKPAGTQRRMLLRQLLLRMPRNYLFYFSTLEIELGSMDRTNFDATYKVLKEWRDQLYPYLARIVVPVVYNFVKAQVGDHPAQEQLLSSIGSNLGCSGDDSGCKNEPDERRLKKVAHALLFLKDTDDTVISSLALSTYDAPLPIALAVATQTGDVLVRSTNVACDDLARQAFGAGTQGGTAEAIRDYITSSEEARTAVLNWQPLTCIVPTGETPIVCVFQPVICRTVTVVVVCLCGGDDLYLARDLDVASSLISAIVSAQQIPNSASRTHNDRAARDGIVAQGRADKVQHSRESSSSNAHSVVPEPTGARQPGRTQHTVRGSTSGLPAWHFTASGARAPVVVGANQALTKQKWHQMDHEDKYRHVVKALKKIQSPKSRVRQTTHSLVSQYQMITSKGVALDALSCASMNRKDLEDKIARLESSCDEAEIALKAVLDRCTREMATLERRHIWERDAMVRAQKAEIDELEMRQVDEVQGFVDKVAESRSAVCVTPGGRTKRPPCACMHSYLCVHNKRGIVVANHKSIGLERKHTVAANSLVAHHAKFRDALLQRHQTMLDLLLEKHEAATKVLSSRHSLISRRAESKLSAIERDLQEAYFKLKKSS